MLGGASVAAFGAEHEAAAWAVGPAEFGLVVAAVVADGHDRSSSAAVMGSAVMVVPGCGGSGSSGS